MTLIYTVPSEPRNYRGVNNNPRGPHMQVIHNGKKYLACLMTMDGKGERQVHAILGEYDTETEAERTLQDRRSEAQPESAVPEWLRKYREKYSND